MDQPGFLFLVPAEESFDKCLKLFEECLAHLCEHVCFFVYMFAAISIYAILVSQSREVVTLKRYFAHHLFERLISRTVFLSHSRVFGLILGDVECCFFD